MARSGLCDRRDMVWQCTRQQTCHSEVEGRDPQPPFRGCWGYHCRPNLPRCNRPDVLVTQRRLRQDAGRTGADDAIG